MQNLLNEYIINFCSTCKAKECDKGIVFISQLDRYTQKEIKIVKCVDYEKDETKITGYKKPLYKTAPEEKCLMPNLLSRK